MNQKDFHEIIILGGGGSSDIEFSLGSLACWKFYPREPHFQSVVNNRPNRCSNLAVYEGLLGDTCTILLSAQVDCCCIYIG